jgi:hypothetical protein
LSEAEVTAHRVRNIGQLHVVEHLLDAPAKAPVLMKNRSGREKAVADLGRHVLREDSDILPRRHRVAARLGTYDRFRDAR